MRTLLLLTSLLGISTVLSAQNAPLACDGRMATVRVSEIKAGGTSAGFLAAVAAQQAWYKAQGSKDELVLSRIVVRDATTHATSYSGKQYLTFHVRASREAGPKHDDGFDAFVKLFQDNSEIKSEYNVCLPNFGGSK